MSDYEWTWAGPRPAVSRHYLLTVTRHAGNLKKCNTNWRVPQELFETRGVCWVFKKFMSRRKSKQIPVGHGWRLFKWWRNCWRAGKAPATGNRNPFKNPLVFGAIAMHLSRPHLSTVTARREPYVVAPFSSRVNEPVLGSQARPNFFCLFTIGFVFWIGANFSMPEVKQL